MTEEKLLQGVVDFHVHCYPSFMERACDFVALCYLAEKAGYKAIGHKDHNYASAGLASEIKMNRFADSPLQIFGTLAMNQSVGGMDPVALESALTFGTRAVWFPTVSAKNHIDFTAKVAGFPKAVSGPKTKPDPIVLTDSEGELIPQAAEALKILARYPNVAIGSGHGSPAEIDALVKRCVELGIADRFFVDHPYEIIEAELDDMIRWARQGAVIEFVAGMSVPPTENFPLDTMIEYIRAIGVEHVILLSDLGQKNKGDPVAVYGKFLKGLYDHGLHEDEIRYMTSYLPGKMIGLN
ncbi:MAG: DUF6282 family protein [Oscillospiraceae bacterium]